MTIEMRSSSPVLARLSAEVGDVVEEWKLEILTPVEDEAAARREAMEAILTFLLPVLPSEKVIDPAALRHEFGHARGYRRHVELDVCQDATVGMMIKAPHAGDTARVPKPTTEEAATEFLRFQRRWLSGLLAAEILEHLSQS